MRHFKKITDAAIAPTRGRTLSGFLLLVLLLSALASPQSALALGRGDRVIVQNATDGLFIRSGAGTGYNPPLGAVYNGETGTIVSGPRSGNGYTWWRVDWDSPSLPTGWSVEFFDGYRVIALLPSSKPDIASVSDASASEGNSLTFTVQLSGRTGQTETYYYSTYYGGGATAERSDYGGADEESMRVSSGRSSFTIRISTIEDTEVEGDETFYLYVTGEDNHPGSTPGSSRYRGMGTIRNDDEAAQVRKPDIASVSDASASEGNSLTFTVQLSGRTGQTETYYYSTYYGGGATAERSDYGGADEESMRVSSGRSSFTIRISTIEDTEVEGDETFYLYVTGEDNHPGSTPGSSRYRGMGTIRNDDEAAQVRKPDIASVSDASASEGNSLTFTVQLSGRTGQTETYYYSTYYGGGATAERSDYGGADEESMRVSSGRSSFTIRISTIEDTEVEGDETFYLYVTGEDNHPGSTPGSSRYRGMGTIRNDDDTGPTLGRDTYTFSLNDETYTVTSDDCYDRTSASREEYIAGLRIYNNRNELARPASNILFQLSAAHASACIIDGINLGERLNEINNLISYAQVYGTALRRSANLSHTLSFLADSLGFEKLRQAVNNLPTNGLIDLNAIGKIGLSMVQGVLSFLGQEALYEKQQMAAEIVSENFFAWPEIALDGARDIYIGTKTNIDLSGTTNVAAVRDHMQALDAAMEAVETAKLSIPAGWNLAKLMYSSLEGSVADAAFDLAVNVASLLDTTGLISTTVFIIDTAKLRIHLKAIEESMVHLASLELDFIRQSPFDTFPLVNPNVTPMLTVPSAPYVVDKDSGWMRLFGLSVSDADNDNLRLAVAVQYGQLRATGTMVVRLNVSDTDFEDAIRFNRSSPSSINTALATLEYRPPQNWEEGRDFILLWLTDNKVQTPVFGIVPIDPNTQGTPGGGGDPDPDYCQDFGPCSVGEGDCDPGQCGAGLVCINDVGAQYGLPAHYDVCETPGGGSDPDYCQDFGPCSVGEGDCDPGQCGAGLVCINDVGAQYGLPAHYDVCETPAVLFADDMESGVNGWFTDVAWALTTAASRSGTHAWTVSPEYDCDGCFYLLDTPTIDLTGVSSATLTFWHRYDFASGDWGTVGVWISQGGQGGGLLEEIRHFTGTNPTWQQVSIDLTPFVGEPIKIGFVADIFTIGTADGWYIDDVTVFSSDVEP